MVGEDRGAAVVPPLAPCPFCGSQDVVLTRGMTGTLRDNGHRYALCRACHGGGPWRPVAEAAAAWNRSAVGDAESAAKAIHAAMALLNALDALLTATSATERACAEHAARAVRAEVARQFAGIPEDA